LETPSFQEPVKHDWLFFGRHEFRSEARFNVAFKTAQNRTRQLEMALISEVEV
jgi:hypothetical protein